MLDNNITNEKIDINIRRVTRKEYKINSDQAILNFKINKYDQFLNQKNNTSYESQRVHRLTPVKMSENKIK